MWDDDRIDAAIDDAARELTAGEPGPEFRARVMARIARASKFSLWWTPLAAGAAVAAIVAIAVIWRPVRDSQPPQTQEVRLKPDAPYRNEAPSRSPLPRAETHKARLQPAATGVRLKADTTYSTGPDATDVNGVAPLTTTPLDLESIAVPALSADVSLRIDPLPSAPSIAVAPLGAEPEGDRR